MHLRLTSACKSVLSKQDTNRKRKKKDIRKRGIKSPNKADSLLLAFCPTYKKKKRKKLIKVNL